jgi:hypothetical protein
MIFSDPNPVGALRVFPYPADSTPFKQGQVNKWQTFSILFKAAKVLLYVYNEEFDQI